MTEGTNYTVASYSDGEYNITNVPEYNSTDGDELRVDYTYNEGGVPRGQRSIMNIIILIFVFIGIVGVGNIAGII